MCASLFHLGVSSQQWPVLASDADLHSTPIGFRPHDFHCLFLRDVHG